jgi:hypothetical protein
MSKRAASQELDHDPMMAKKFAHLKITSDNDIVPAHDFALSILENRKLAQYVRHVSLNYNHWTPFPVQALSYTVTTEVELENEARFKAAIAEQKWEEAEATELLRRLVTPSLPRSFNNPSSHQLFPDAVVALLLPILPNVQRWTVGDIDQPTYVGKAIERAKDGIFGSISVTHLELLANAQYSNAAWADYNFPAFKVFQNLLSLESISGKGIGSIGIEDAGSYHDIPSKASVVREIHLKDCELSGACLSKIINFSTGLGAFTYRFGGRSGDGSSGVLYSPQLAKALTPHRSMMRSLDIDIDDLMHQSLAEAIQCWESELKDEEDAKTEGEDEEDSEADTLDSADSKAIAKKWEEATKSEPYFPNLTNLRIGIKLASRFAELSGKKTLAEWLPASLKELEFVGYRPQESDVITQQVTEAVQLRQKLLPNLEVLKGVEEYIENGKELDKEDDYITSDDSVDENAAEEIG